VFAAPEVFRMPGAEALRYESNPGDEQRETILRAAAVCPVQAIVVDQAADESAAVASTRAASAPAGNGRIVIVGAGLAGWHAAHALRRGGFAGALTIVGDEVDEPYDRVPLSKQVLTGSVPAERTALPHVGRLDADWRLGQPAVGLDRRNKRVLLPGGEQVAFDRLLIATGVRAREWPNSEEAALDGVYTVRGRNDAATLRQKLAAGPRRVLVIGAGFIGSELASDCRELGLPVTVVERGPAPLAGALGAVIGRIAAGMQREAGVDLRCGVSVRALEGDPDGRLRRARLSDGTPLDVDVAIAALGSRRNTEWLAGSGLAAGRWGVSCDAGCRAFDVTQGSVTDRRFAAAYGRQGHVAAAVTFDQGMWLEFYRDLIDRAAPFPPRFRTWGGSEGTNTVQPPARQPVPAEIPAAPEALAGQATVVLTGHEPSERRAVLVPDR
jgi:3-phenylpropionate/trans-cinnamate dioxygenase ferredoxin reductase component